MDTEVGKWAFLIGALLAVVLGVGEGVGQAWATNAWLLLLLLVLGLVIGFVNISKREVQPFLLSVVALLASAAAASLMNANTLFVPLGTILASVVKDVILVVAPAALVVALKEVYEFCQAD